MTDRERRGFLDMLEPGLRQELLGRARIVRVRKGQTVLARGEASADVFLLQFGRLQVTLYAPSGREVSLRDLSAGQMFGELSAIDGEMRSVGIQALSDARLMVIGRDAFRRLINDSPNAREWLMCRFVSQVRGLTERVYELSALNVQERVRCELLRLARATPGASGTIEPAPTHAELANRVSTHREAVTRELGALSQRNIIRSGRRRLQVLDLARLEHEVGAALTEPPREPGWW